MLNVGGCTSFTTLVGVFSFNGTYSCSFTRVLNFADLVVDEMLKCFMFMKSAEISLMRIIAKTESAL